MKKRRMILFLLVIFMVLVGVICMFNNGKNDEENEVMVRYVSMDEITEIMEQNEDYIILDVRTFEEYNLGHIPNAICIPNETIGPDVEDELPDKNQLILIYCRSGNRSKQATKKLEKLGYTNLVEFGGIIDWNGKLEQ